MREREWALAVDPIRCHAHGLCAELVPEVVVLDEWGYPMFVATVPDWALDDARAAVSACPTLALRLTRTDASSKPGTARADSVVPRTRPAR